MNTKKILTGVTGSILALSFVATAFAQTTTNVVGIPPPPDKPKTTTLNLSCVQTAVDKRENAIGSAFTTFASAQSAALSARKAALHDAWGMTDTKARRAARNKAWSDYHAANKAAYKALRDARKSAWETFVKASQSCKIPVVEAAEQEGEGSLGL